ncbi:MAG: oligogalacturonate lyase family protein [Bacteroidota bacterium]
MKQTTYLKSIFSFTSLLLLAFSCTSSDETSEKTSVGKQYASEKFDFEDEITGMKKTGLTNSEHPDIKIYQTHPQWTSDSEFILFTSTRDTTNNHTEVFAVRESDGLIIQLTEDAKNIPSHLVLSRQKNLLYFIRSHQVVELNLDVILPDESTSKDPVQSLRIISDLPSDAAPSGSMSIDANEQILYLGLQHLDTDNPKSEDPKRWSLAAIDISTGEWREVVSLDWRIGHSQANPWKTGEILFCHETGGDAPQRMWLINANGQNLHPLFEEHPKDWVTHEVWADVDHVIFNMAGNQAYQRERPSGIMMIDVRTNEHRLIDQPPLEESQSGYWHCAISPDGRWIAGDTFEGLMYLINAQTGERQLIGTGHRPDDSPKPHSHHHFSPDGNRVLLNAAPFGHTDLITIDISPLIK